MIVEFAGPPGSGKSTLCRTVVAALTDAGVAVEDRSVPSGPAGRRRRLARKCVVVAGWTVRHPGYVLAVARACRRSGLGARERLARTVNLVVLRAEAHRPARGVVLFDQGVTQEVTSVAMTADHHILLAELPAGSWPCADVVVRVRVPTDVAVDRLRRRCTGESRVEALPPAARRDAIDGVDRVLDDVLGSGSGDPRLQGAEVWEVDGTDPALTSQLTARIRRSQAR